MSRTARWLLVLLLLFVLANVITVGLGAGNKTQQTADFSSYRRGGQGSAALYGLFERLGYPVARHQDVLTSLPEDCRQLWVLYPTQPLAREEMVALEDWVYNGGQLVCSWDFMVYATLFARTLMPGGEDKDNPFPLLADARPAAPSLGAGSLSTVLPGVSHAGVYASTGLREGLFEDVRILRFPDGKGLSSYKGWTPLVQAEGQVLIAAAPLGQGWVVFLADPECLGNLGLADADNAVFASNLAAMSPGGIYLDEQHHGFSGRPRSVVALVKSSRGAPAAAVVLLGIVLCLIAVGWRFGRPQDPKEPVRRSSLEYVHSLADLYYRAGARKVALRALYDTARRRLAGSTGSGDLSHGQLARLASMRLGIPAEEIEGILTEARGALEDGCKTDADALRLARSLARLTARPRARVAATRPQGR